MMISSQHAWLPYFERPDLIFKNQCQSLWGDFGAHSRTLGFSTVRVTTTATTTIGLVFDSFKTTCTSTVPLDRIPFVP